MVEDVEGLLQPLVAWLFHGRSGGTCHQYGIQAGICNLLCVKIVVIQLMLTQVVGVAL